MMDVPLDGHPDEGQMVRLLDDELEANERRALEDHLTRCPPCSTALEQLREAAITFRMELRDDTIDAPQSTGWTGVPRNRIAAWWRIAATIAILLAASATLRPVRALVQSGWESVAAAFGFAPVAEAPETTLEPPAPAGPVVTFVPRGTVITIDVDSWQTSGSVHIEFGDAREVSAQIVTPGTDENIVVVPNRGVRIGNASSTKSDYRVVVPDALERVIVTVAGERVADFEPEREAANVSVSLTRN